MTSSGDAVPREPNLPHGATARGAARADVGVWYEAVLDQSGDAFVVVEAVRTDTVVTDWRVVAANAAARAWWHVTEAESTGALVGSFAATPATSALPALWSRVLDTTTTVETTLELPDPTGATLACAVRIVPVGHDTVAVTTRSAGSAAADPGLDSAATRGLGAEGEARLLHALVEHGSDMVLMVDATATITWASDSAERLIGYRSGDLVGRDALSLVHRDDVTTLTEYLVDALAAPVAFERPVQLRALTSDQRVRWFEAVGRNRLDDPELGGLILHLRDITEHRETAERLREAEARTRGILDSAVDGIVTVDSDGTVEGFNRGAEEIFGWLAGDIVGRRCDVLFGPGNLQQLLGEATNAGGQRMVPGFGIRRDGTRFPAQMSMSRFLVADRPVITAIVRDVSEQRTAEARLRLMALNDPLTGLPNRREMTTRIDTAIERARVTGRGVGVLYLDLDRFKLINDTLGHQVGDQLLVLAGARISSLLRAGDTIGRLGGDEFVVLCEHLRSSDDALEIATRISESLALPFDLAGRSLFVTGSVGVSVWDGGPEAAVDLLRQADTAVYRAKDDGPGHVKLFDRDMHTSVTTRLEQESALRRALELGELRAYYQPVVRLDDAGIEKFEALARWERPGIGVVQPAEFIPIAEDTGLIVELGAFMLRQAATDCVHWQAIAPGVGVTVNVSAHQFTQPDLAATVLQTLFEVGLAPELLTLEITESAMTRDPEHTLAALEAMRSVGVQIALDDFGTGYSSLTQLRTLPIDTLKIDRSFVETLDTDAGDASIVQAIIDLGQARGLEIVAEGVATQSIARRLRLLGCEHAQGYLYSFPVPFAQTIRLLEVAHSPRREIAN